MSRWYAEDIPLGQKDDGERGTLVNKDVDSRGNVVLSWSSGKQTTHAPREQVKGVCCGSCRAAGVPSNKWGNRNDRVTKAAERDIEREQRRGWPW